MFFFIFPFLLFPSFIFEKSQKQIPCKKNLVCDDHFTPDVTFKTLCEIPNIKMWPVADHCVSVWCVCLGSSFWHCLLNTDFKSYNYNLILKLFDIAVIKK